MALRFHPRLATGDAIMAANAEFALQVAQYHLQFQCSECAYFRSTDRQCMVGWPNDDLMHSPVVALNAVGEPVFCKAFEADAG